MMMDRAEKIAREILLMAHERIEEDEKYPMPFIGPTTCSGRFYRDQLKNLTKDYVCERRQTEAKLIMFSVSCVTVVFVLIILGAAGVL